MVHCFMLTASQPALQLHSPQNQTSKSRAVHSSVTLPSPVIQQKPIDGVRRKTRIQPLIDLLRECAAEGLTREAKAVHGYVTKFDFVDQESLVLLNHVIHAYLKSCGFGAARKLFDEMAQRNAFSWTSMIVGCNESGNFVEAIRFFRDMQSQGIPPDKHAFSAVIQTCIALNCISLGAMIHAQTVIRGICSHNFVSISLLSMYAKLGYIVDSCRVFKYIENHSDVSWNAMISGFTSNGMYEEAFNHFLKMKDQGFTPNVYTLISILKAVGELGDVIKGKEVHSYASELSLESNHVVGTALIDMYSKCGSLRNARSVFDMNFTDSSMSAPWNAIISGYSQYGCSREALDLFTRMRQNNVHPDIYTHCSIFNAISALRCLQFGMQVHGMVLKSGSASLTVSVSNAIIDAYSKCGSIGAVRKVFDKMEERDIVSWTTLLTAYSQMSAGEEALVIFLQMREEGFTPNRFTFSSVLVACSGLGFLEYGRQVHALVCKVGLHTVNCTESCLIDMYAKSGNVVDARKVFDTIFEPDVVSWTTIISAYAQHGFGDCALQLFRRMKQCGVKANAVTLLCILFACSHGGLVDEGLYYFRKMETNHGIVPAMEHYACIVDLLGRVGRLDEALQFIERMPVEPNDMVWQSLLGACRVHGNVDLGEIAARRILSVRPESSATYVLLSNTYFGTGRVKYGLSMRNAMKERRVRKDPGYSWILVNDRVHKFYSGDQEHPQKDDIYAKLEELTKTIIPVDYELDVGHMFQEVV